MKSALSPLHFHNDEAAFAFVESALWPDGPVCPHCGVAGQAGKLSGKTTRPGLWKCYACRKPFTVQSRPAADLAASDLPHVLVEEGDQHPPTSADLRRQHENGVVPHHAHS